MMKPKATGMGVAEGKVEHMMVEMPYIGYRLSVNHCYFTNSRGQRVLRAESRAWRDGLALTLKSLLQGEEIVSNAPVRLHPPLKIILCGRFKDKRHPDLANLHKLVGDGVEIGTGINDKHYLFEDLAPEIDRNAEPILRITIQGGE